MIGMLKDKIASNREYVLTFMILSVFILATLAFADNDPPATPADPAVVESTAGPAGVGGSQTSQFPRCVGGDMSRLQSSTMIKCNRFSDLFDRYMQSTGLTELGVDKLLIYEIARGESSCNSKNAGDSDAPHGGILEAVHDCTSGEESDKPNKCHSTEDEIRYGIEEFVKHAQAVQRQGFTGQAAGLMFLFSYNRGTGTLATTKQYMDERNIPLAQAAQEACGYRYADYEAFPNRRNFCYDYIPEMFGCDGNRGDSMCRDGKTCSYYSGCRLLDEDRAIGIHYAGSRWSWYVQDCERIGGHIVAEGAPIERVGAVAEAAGDALGAMGPEFRPTHPYFTVPYSVNPSFSTEIPYDFSIYDTIPGYLNRLERCKDDIDCIVNNASIIEDENPGFDWIIQYGGEVVSRDDSVREIGKWQAYCETPEQHAVNSLAEAVDNCGRSQDNDCVCSYLLPVPSVPVSETDLFGNILSSASDLLGIEFFGRGEEQEWEERALELRRQGNGVRISVIPEGDTPAQLVRTDFKDVDDSLEPVEPGETLAEMVARAIARSTSFVIGYKPEDAGKKLHIYKDNRGNITIYPENQAPSTNTCEVNNKMVKFCIVQNQTFLAYNQMEDKMGVQQLVLKFAYLFRSEVTDVRNFTVKDAKMKSNTSLITWEPMQGVDINYYTIYYSPDDENLEASLRGQSPADLEQGLRDRVYLNAPIQLFVDMKQDVMISLDSLEHPVCDVIPGQGTCSLEYEITTQGESVAPMYLYPGDLFFSAVDNKFFYLMPDVLNDESYFFAITATDMNGDESPSFNMPGQGDKEPSRDDVPPALANVRDISVDETSGLVHITIDEVTKNIIGDDTFFPAEKYKVYCFWEGIQEEMSLDPQVTNHVAFISPTVSNSEGNIEFTVPLADFNSGACGLDQSLPGPLIGRLVVAGTRRVQGSDVGFQGTVNNAHLSAAGIPIQGT